MKSSTLKVLALLLVLGMVAAACSKKPDEGGGKEGGTITIGQDKANNHGSEDVSGNDEFKVEIDDFYFEPTVLKGTAGQKVKLELDNEGSALHNFSLPEQNLDQDVAAGKDGEVTVTFPQSGILEFFCKYHRGRGMAGELSTS